MISACNLPVCKSVYRQAFPWQRNCTASVISFQDYFQREVIIIDEREREGGERQTDRQTDRQREADRETERDTHRERHRERHTERHRETVRDRDRDRERSYEREFQTGGRHQISPTSLRVVIKCEGQSHKAVSTNHNF